MSANVNSADSPSIPRIVLEGGPYEIGFKHGHDLRIQILSQLDIYREIFFQKCKFDWSHVRTVAKEFESSIGKLAPDILEEIRGIADGVRAAGGGETDHLDIIALNARSEIALGQWSDGCTALSWHLNGRQILAQNWDWRPAVAKNLAIVDIRQEEKPEIWMVTEPGIVGKIGFNSSSVGVCLNAIRARPVNTSLLPIHIILRLCLESRSIIDAITRIEGAGGAASSQHILIADENGGRGLELSPRGGVYLSEDADGLVVHTNHFLANRLVDEPPWLTGSPFRLQRARDLTKDLASEYGSESVDKLRQTLTPSTLREKIFADEQNLPQAICASPDPTHDSDAQTIFNIVMEFEKGAPPRAEVVFGKPSEVSESQVQLLP